ncbi:unnamed protein product [Musa textilis]
MSVISALQANHVISDSSGADIEELVSIEYNRSSEISSLEFSSDNQDALELLVGANSEDNQHAPINQPKDDQGPSTALANDDKMDMEEHKYQRDEVMTDKHAKEVTGDPLADYDREV